MVLKHFGLIFLFSRSSYMFTLYLILFKTVWILLWAGLFDNLEYLDICSETWEADEDFVCDFEDFGEIGGNCVKLLTISVIGSDADAVVARHADDRASVVLKSHSEKAIFLKAKFWSDRILLNVGRNEELSAPLRITSGCWWRSTALLRSRRAAMITILLRRHLMSLLKTTGLTVVKNRWWCSWMTSIHLFWLHWSRGLEKWIKSSLEPILPERKVDPVVQSALSVVPLLVLHFFYACV